MVTSPALRPADATLWEPLTAAEIEARSDQHGRLTGRVPVEFEDLIDGTRESFLDDLTEKLVGQNLLTDIFYQLDGYDSGTLIFDVTGSVYDD